MRGQKAASARQSRPCEQQMDGTLLIGFIPFLMHVMSYLRRQFLGLLVGMLIASGVMAQGAMVSPAVQSPFSRVELLVHAPNGVAPGEPVWLGLQITHAPEWHTYWRNPGDSGLPTELEWQLPSSVVPGAPQWPTPRKFPLGDLANYGYDGIVLLPVPLQIDSHFQASTLQAEVLATWLICRLECIPEEASFQLQLPTQVSVANHREAFEAAWSAQPVDQAAGNSLLIARGERLEAVLTGLPAQWQGQTLEFFPETPGLIEPGGAWQQQWDNDQWRASIPLSRFRQAGPESVPLVVALANPPGKGPGLPGIRMEVPVPEGWPTLAIADNTGASDALRAALAANAARAAQSPPASPQSLTLWAALLGALIGGMILNLMPCVFPVLAIKVLSFSQKSDQPRLLRLGGLAYTMGVVVSFVALGALLLALRAAGEELGWGFQLQNPAVVASLAVLFTLIGLNLAGLFQFGHVVPSALAGLQVRNPTADSFLTGVLATAVASPCTAPFMGASLGLAVALPAGQALTVFAVLGLGMALPYLVASWIPSVARALPRPGPWMESVRQLMAFPMFATVVWLLWVLGQQSGIDGAAALLMILVVLAWLIWALDQAGRTRILMGLVSAFFLVGVIWTLGPNVTRQPAAAQGMTPTAVDGLVWEAWSPQRESELIGLGRPVFVDYTAAWCVTCQFNKRNALSDEVFLQEAAARGVTLLRADWTRRDPAVTQALAELGRNGVPVYVLHAPGRAPLILSEILTAEDVRAAIRQL